MIISDTKSAPRRRQPIDGRRWFLDTEGNGRKVGQIVELGLVETIDLVPTGVMHSWLIRPTESIEWNATRVHGIHNSDVADKPTMAELADEIASILGDTPIGGQAVHGDMDVLTRSLPGWRTTSAIDSFGMAKSLLPDLESYKLAKMTEALGLRQAIDAAAGGRAHSALNDAMACAMLIQEMRRITPEKAFAHAFAQGESLERWDRMVQRRIDKVVKTQTRAQQKEARRIAQRKLEAHVKIHGSNRSRAREARAAYQEAESKKGPPQEGRPCESGEDA